MAGSGGSKLLPSIVLSSEAPSDEPEVRDCVGAKPKRTEVYDRARVCLTPW
jgi:hypothetical protein